MPIARDQPNPEKHTIAGVELPRRLTVSDLFMMADGANIPPNMIDPLVRYVVDHRRPGHFLTALLENDFREACNRADDVNREALYRYAYFLTNYAPAACWGSKKNVDAWLELGRLARSQKV